MLRRTRLHSACLLAILTLGAIVGMASANRFSVNEQGWRHVWNPITFQGGEGLIRVSCPLTVEGSFHSAVSQKTARALSGFVSRTNLNAAACTGGSATVLQETLPWHVVYVSFRGTLPRITGITDELIGTGFVIETALGLRCLARMTAERPGRSIISLEAAGAATSIRADETALIPLTGSLCPERGTFSGTGSITRLGSTGSIVVTLI